MASSICLAQSLCSSPTLGLRDFVLFFPPFPFLPFFFSNIYEVISHLSWHVFSTVGVSGEGSDNKLQKVFSPKQQLCLLANAVSGAFPEDWPRQKGGSDRLVTPWPQSGFPGSGISWWKALVEDSGTTQQNSIPGTWYPRVLMPARTQDTSEHPHLPLSTLM